MRTFTLLTSLTLLSGLAYGQSSLRPGTEGTDLRLNVTNALIQSLQNSRRVTLDLKWDYLPDASHVEAMKTVYDMAWPTAKNFVWGEWKISNKLLKSKDGWSNVISKMPEADRKFLGTVLNAGNPKDEGDKAIDLKGKTNEQINALIAKSIVRLSATNKTTGWTEVAAWPQPGLILGLDPGFANRANYSFCLSMLRALMSSRGMGLKIEEATGKLRLNGSKFLSDQIVWTIRAYRSSLNVDTSKPLSQQPIPQTFTLTIEGSIRNIKFDLISTESQQADQVGLNLTAGLVSDIKVLNAEGEQREVPAMVPWTIAEGTTSVQSEALPGTETLKTETISPSSTSMILDIVGGVDAGKGLGNLLFNNNENAHLFTGGLVGNGPVQRVLGVNTVAPDAPLGVMMGLIPDNSNALFIGPSLNLGIFTLGAGGRFFGREDGSTTAKWAGVLSIDLTRVFSKPPPLKAVAFVPQDSSTAFWRKFPVSLENLVIATFAFKMDGDLPAGSMVTLSELAADGTKLNGGKIYRIRWKPDGKIYQVQPLTPKGKYLLEYPEGVKAFDHQDRPRAAPTVLTVTDNTATFNIQLKKED